MSTTPTPAPMTGRKAERDGDTLLVIERRFRAPIDDVWAACTDPGRMQRWIGTWSGDPASGSVSFRMTAEGEDVAAEEMEVLACDPPRRFAVRGTEPQTFSEDGSGDKVFWEMELELTEAEGVTSLRFAQVLAPGATGIEMVASVGPGWDYYLDRLVAALDGATSTRSSGRPTSPGPPTTASTSPERVQNRAPRATARRAGAKTFARSRMSCARAKRSCTRAPPTHWKKEKAPMTRVLLDQAIETDR